MNFAEHERRKERMKMNFEFYGLHFREKNGILTAGVFGEADCDIPVSDIRIAGRATQGVRLINIKDGDSIAAVSAVRNSGEDNASDVSGVQDGSGEEDIVVNNDNE